MGKLTKMPEGWLPYSTIGATIPGTRFIAFKVPLRESFVVKLKPEDKFTIPILLKRLPSLGLVIDLTQTVRYYNKNEFLDRGVDYVKIATPGQEVPPQQLVDKFFEVVDYFLETHKNENTLIGVHCTHGVNRTGYMISRYLIQRMNFSFEEAVEIVGRSRGHMIERSPYLASLRKHVGPVKKNALNRSSIEASRQKKVEEKLPKKPPPPRRLGKEPFAPETYPSRGGRTPPDVRVKSPREMYERTMLYGPPPHGAFSPPAHPDMRGRSPVRMHGRSPQPVPRGRTPPFPMRGRSPQGMRGRSPSPGMRGRSPMGMRGRSPPSGMRGRSSPLGMRGRSPPPSIRGRSPPPSVRGRSPPPSSRGRSPPGMRGRSPPSGIRGRSPPPSVRGRSPLPGMRGRSPPPSVRGRSPPPSMRGRSPLSGMRGRSPPPNIRGRSPTPGMMGRSPPRGMRGRSPPSGMRGRSPPGIRERSSPGMRPPPGYYGRSSSPMLRGYSLSQVPGERSSPPIIRGRSSPSDLHRSSDHTRMPPPDVYDRSSSSLMRGRTPPSNIRGRALPFVPRGRSPPFYAARGRSPPPLRSGNPPASNRGRSPPGKRMPPTSFRDRSPLRRRSISPSGRREALHPRNRSRSPSSMIPGRSSPLHPVRRRTPPSDRRDLLIAKRGRSPHMARGDGPPLRDRSLSPRRDNLNLPNLRSRSPLPPPKADRDRDMGLVEGGLYHGFRDYVGNFSPGRNKNYSDSGYAPEYVGRSNPNRPNSRSPRRESDPYYHDTISKFTSSGDFVPPKDKRKRKSPSPLDKRATKDRRSPSDYSNGRGGVSGSAYWENQVPLDGPDCREILNEKRSLKEPFPDLHDEPFQEKDRRFSQDRFNSQEVDIREALDQEKRKRALQNPEGDVFPAKAMRPNDGIRHSVREYGESSGSHPRRGGDDRGSHSYSKGSSYQGGGGRGDDRKMNSGGHFRGSMGRGGGGGYRGQGGRQEDDKRRPAYRGKPSHRGARTAPFWT